VFDLDHLPAEIPLTTIAVARGLRAAVSPLLADPTVRA